MPALPNKLKKDAIAEALCELRFECQESTSLPEIVVGRLAEFQEWSHFQKVRLPTFDIPAPIRSQDSTFKYQPLLELRETNPPRLAKIGANVLSYHRLAPYPGWKSFKPEIERTVAFLFNSFQSLRVLRLGFRYINVFTEEDHGVRSVSDLKYSAKLGRDYATPDVIDLNEPQNFNYLLNRSQNHLVQVRIASPEFVSGSVSKKVQVLMDIDVFTPVKFVTDKLEVVKDWVEAAHGYEKEEFFRVFTNEMKKKLVEESV
jgi:uncharacterized protein (TIGR04255 family)